MPRKKIEFPENEKEEKYEEVWDIRKIILGVVILLFLFAGAIFAKRLLFHESIAPGSFIPKITFPAVQGANTGPDNLTKITHVNISLPTQQDLTNQIQHIQNQAAQLNLQEIATSSPEVQQVLQQIQDLPKEGTTQVKQACMRLCDNL